MVGSGAPTAPIAVIGRIGWALFDQGLSSATNFSITVFAARVLNPRDFGAFGVAITVSLLAMGLARSLATEPLLSRPDSVTDGGSEKTFSGVAGAATGIGLVLAGGVIVSGLLAGGATRAALIVLGAAMPVLLVQDSWRYCFISQGRPRLAVANDACWLGVQAVVLLFISFNGKWSTVSVLAAWGAGACVAAVLGAFQAHSVPSLRGGWLWLVSQSDLASRYCIEFLTAGGASNGVLLGLGAIAGLVALGSFRAAQTFFGPLFVSFVGIYLAVVPEAAKFRDDPRRLRRLSSLLCVGVVLGAVVWTAAGILVPISVGQALFGKTWTSARAVMFPLGVSLAAGGLAAGPMVGLRGLAAARESLKARLVGLPFYLALPTIGASLSGARGFTYGLTMAALISAGAFWWQFLVCTSQRPVDPARESPTLAEEKRRVRTASPSGRLSVRLGVIQVVFLLGVGLLVAHRASLAVIPIVVVGAALAVASVGMVGVARISWTFAMIFAPMNALRVTSFATVADVFVVVAALAMATSGVARRRPKLSGPDASLVGGLLLVVLGGTVGTFFAPSVASSISELGRFGFATLGTVTLFTAWKPDAIELRRLAWAWLIGASIDATWAITGGAHEYGGRLLGFNGQPNLLGLVALLGLALSAGLCMSSHGWRARTAALLALPLAVALVLSGSRAALLGLCVMVPLIGLLTRRYGILLRVSALGCVALIALISGATHIPRNTSLGRISGATSTRLSDSERKGYLRDALGELARHPLTGHGFADVKQAHNIFIQIAIAGGPISLYGLCAVAWVIVVRGARSGLREWGPATERGILALAVVAGYVGYLVLGLFQPILWERSLWLYVALAVGLARIAGTPADQDPARDAPAPAILGVVEVPRRASTPTPPSPSLTHGKPATRG